MPYNALCIIILCKWYNTKKDFDTKNTNYVCQLKMYYNVLCIIIFYVHDIIKNNLNDTKNITYVNKKKIVSYKKKSAFKISKEISPFTFILFKKKNPKHYLRM